MQIYAQMSVIPHTIIFFCSRRAIPAKIDTEKDPIYNYSIDID